jgi:hypothetical protein
MPKPDMTLRQTTIAAIKRRTMLPHDWKFTRYFETELIKDLGPIGIELESVENELPIASVVKSKNDWMFVTTRKVVGLTNCVKQEMKFADIGSIDWGFFKDTKNVTGLIHLRDLNGQTNQFIIENGKPAMVIISAITTLTQLNRGSIYQ